MKMNSSIQSVQLSPNPNNGCFRLKHYLPIDYDSLCIDLLDAHGNETDIPLKLTTQSETEIEIQLEKLISGVFQVRMRDEKIYFIKKIIIK